MKTHITKFSWTCLLVMFSIYSSAQILYQDDFSGTLSNWVNPTGQGTWTINNAQLYGSYSTGCGSVTCPQADLLLIDPLQPQGDYKVSAQIVKAPAYSGATNASVRWSLWQDDKNKISLWVGFAGKNPVANQQDTIFIGRQEWRNKWNSSLTWKVPITWYTDSINIVSMIRRDSVYEIYLNDNFLMNYNDSFLKGNGKIGFHTYGDLKVDNFQLENAPSPVTFTMRADSMMAYAGIPVLVPVYFEGADSTKQFTSATLRLKYNPSVLEYLQVDQTGTGSSGGTISISTINAGEIEILYTGSNVLFGSNTLFNLEFKPILGGSSLIELTEAKLNAVNASSIVNGNVQVRYHYGDPDVNNQIQILDGTITLKYSVGLDPLPTVDPLPWEPWRIITADVDDSTGITAYDAALILRSSSGFISQFPIEDLSGGIVDIGDVVITSDSGRLNFFTQGDLYGLNIELEDNADVTFGLPVLINRSYYLETNKVGSLLRAGMAAPTSAIAGDKILEIPYLLNKTNTVEMDLIVNNVKKHIQIDLQYQNVGIGEGGEHAGLRVYPNPSAGNFTIQAENALGLIQIIAPSGQVVLEIVTESNNYQMTETLPPGCYIVRLTNGDTLSLSKIIIQ